MNKAEWWTKPAVILPVVAAITIIVALLTPQATEGRFGDSRVSSHLTGSLGARLFADMAERMGSNIVRRDTYNLPVPGNGRTIHALLAPVVPVTPAVAHAYLNAVRGGDAMLLALDTRNPLTDSLGVAHHRLGSTLASGHLDNDCANRVDIVPPMWPDGKVHLWGIRWLRPAPGNVRVFARLESESSTVPPPGIAAAGFNFGKGRIAIVSDADLLRNDVLRHCKWGIDVIDANILEWLRAGGEQPRTTLAFDEYHQRFGPTSSVATVTAAFLAHHPVGRTIFQMMVAGLVLLAAIGPRPLPPHHIEIVERRDPLEQVEALANAYRQVRATRTLTARLVRGLRWRVDRGAAVGARSDESFLEGVGSTTPALANDVALLQNALTNPIPDRDVGNIGAAVRRIENSFTNRVT